MLNDLADIVLILDEDGTPTPTPMPRFGAGSPLDCTLAEAVGIAVPGLLSARGMRAAVERARNGEVTRTQWLKEEAVAKRAGVSTRTIRRWRVDFPEAAGAPQALGRAKERRKWRWASSTVDAWLRAVRPQEPAPEVPTYPAPPARRAPVPSSVASGAPRKTLAQIAREAGKIGHGLDTGGRGPDTQRKKNKSR